MTARTLCIVTGSRAEYDLLAPLMTEIRREPTLRLQLIVTGMHLDPRFGATVEMIARDGFVIDRRVPMDLADDTAAGIARAVAQGTVGMTIALLDLQPNVAVVLGDRFEIFAAAQAAMLAGIPIAHLHGGESTEGAFDDAIRHAITKLAHLHFVSTETYRRRVIQMGEAPERVHNVGALGLDVIAAQPLVTRAELAKEIGFDPGSNYFLVTYHPVTLADDPARGVGALLAALDKFPEQRLIFTGVNADPGRSRIAAAIRDYVAARPERATLQASLGSRLYFSAMRGAAAVVGNSSSGLIEAPAFAVPTVNIGDRQRGRLRGDSVLDCPEDDVAITAALNRALDPTFRAGLDTAKNPYGKAGAARRICDILRRVPLDSILIKRFYDLEAAS